MKHFLQQLKRLRDATVLDRAKKDAVREELVNYMSHMRATRAVREQEIERQSMAKRSPILTNNGKNMKFASLIALFAILLAGGGTAFAAEGALPGDTLYPVKVGVNERVAAAFNVSAESQARFNARIAERRLEEAAALAAEGRLNAEAEAELQSSFEGSAERAEAAIAALRSAGKAEAAAEISSGFEAALAAHARALAAIQAAGNGSASGNAEARGNAGVTADIVSTVNAALGAAAESRSDAEGQVTAGAQPDVKVAAEGKIGAAANVIAAVRSRLEDLRARLSAEAEAQAEAEIEAAEELEAEARSELEAGAYAEAFALADRALRTASQVNVLLSIQAQVSGSAGASAAVQNLFGGGSDADDAGTDADAEADANAEADADAGTNVNVGPVNVGL